MNVNLQDGKTSKEHQAATRQGAVEAPEPTKTVESTHRADMLNVVSGVARKLLGIPNDSTETQTEAFEQKISNVWDASRRCNTYLSNRCPELLKIRTRASAATGTIDVALPVITGIFIDSLRQGSPGVVVTAAILLTLPRLQGFIQVKDQYAASRMSVQTLFGERAMLVRQYFSLPLKALRHDLVSTHLEAARSNPNRTYEFANTKFELLKSSTTIFGALGAIAYVNPAIACTIALTVMPLLRIELRKARFTEHFRTMAVKFHKYLWPSFFDKTSTEFVPQLKIMLKGLWATNRIERLGDAVVNHYARMDKGTYKANNAAWKLNSLVAYATGGYVLMQAIQGVVSAGAAIQFLGATYALQGALTTLSSLVGTLQQNAPYVNRSMALAKIAKECGLIKESPLRKEEVDNLKQRIKREDVQLHLKDVEISVHTEKGQEKKILDIPDLTFRLGEYLGLVGEVGSGKSTLAETLVGLRSPTSGRVLLQVGASMYDFEDLPEEILPMVISYNQQDFYPGRTLSILERLELGVKDQEIDQEKLKHIMRVTGIENFAELVELDEIIIGEGIDRKKSRRLSGGQGQSVANGAALAGDFRFLILDEPTSKQDSRQEKSMFDCLERIRESEDKTVILISHRFNTLKDADRIIVLKDGTIEDQGDHKSLLARCETYRGLYDLQ